MANQIIYGLVNNRKKAEKLIQDVLNLGINSQDISFLCSYGDQFQDFDVHSDLQEKQRNWRTEERVADFPRPTSQEGLDKPKGKFKVTKGELETEKHTKAPEGGMTGGMSGGILGLLAGINAFSIPGVGSFIAAGPLLSKLNEIRAGGANGILKILVDAGIPEYEVKHYQSLLQEGKILICVQTNSDPLAKQLKDLFKQDGVEDISASSKVMVSKRNKK